MVSSTAPRLDPRWPPVTYFIDEKLPDFRRQRLIVPWVLFFDVIFLFVSDREA